MNVCLYIQCIGNVFRPLDFFKMLLRYSLIEKCIKLFFPPSIYTQYPIMPKQKQLKKKCLHKYSDPLLSTLLKHLWQRLQPRVFLVMMLQAWHNCIWGVSPILLNRSFKALSGWMGSVAVQIFSGGSRDVRMGSNPGSGWAIQGHSETCPKANPAFSSRISLYFAPFIFALILTSLRTIPSNSWLGFCSDMQGFKFGLWLGHSKTFRDLS